MVAGVLPKHHTSVHHLQSTLQALLANQPAGLLACALGGGMEQHEEEVTGQVGRAGGWGLP